MTTFLSVCLALGLDYLFKEPARCHPLVGFGHWASVIESTLNRKSSRRWHGVLAWAVAVLPVLIPLAWLRHALEPAAWIGILVDGFILYLCIGWQSLLLHARAVCEPLERGEVSGARRAVGLMVSRETDTMAPEDIAAAATESVLENGADAIFSALFWFVLLGPIGAAGYRLSNTLDAMWGYRNRRFFHFGWAAARIDDALNFVPARLTALSYALVGDFSSATNAWKVQAPAWKSPNAGPVMAAGAGAINARLGGGAIYHGQWQERPVLGVAQGEKPSCQTILSACALVNRALCLWVIAMGSIWLAGG